MKPLVTNAADEKQVKEAKSKAQLLRERELNDLRTVLSTKEGRRFIWRLLNHTKVYESIWRPSAEIHHLSGKQDVGHFILGEVGTASEDLLFQMMKEAKKENE